MYAHVGKQVLNVQSCRKTSIKYTLMSENKYKINAHVRKLV